MLRSGRHHTIESDRASPCPTRQGCGGVTRLWQRYKLLVLLRKWPPFRFVAACTSGDGVGTGHDWRHNCGQGATRRCDGARPRRRRRCPAPGARPGLGAMPVRGRHKPRQLRPSARRGGASAHHPSPGCPPAHSGVAPSDPSLGHDRGHHLSIHGARCAPRRPRNTCRMRTSTRREAKAAR
jgi:hypothetical protein